MRLYGVFLLAITIFSGGQLQAQSCSAIDLRRTANSPLTSLPIENQGEHGTCYAYAGATQSNYYMLSHGFDINAQVSPLELAIVSSRLRHQSSLDGGVVGQALAALRANGSYCPRSHLQAWFRQHIAGATEANMVSILQGRLAPEARREFMRNIENFHRDYRASLARESSPPASMLSSGTLARRRLRESELTMRRGRDLLVQAMPDFCVDCIRELNVVERREHYLFMDRMVRWLMAHESANDTEIFAEIVDIACQGHRLPSNVLPTNISYRQDSNSALIQRLNGELESAQAAPPSIEMCSQVLAQPNYQGVHMNPGNVRMPIDGDECGNHAVLVIARRPHGVHGCQYLIRNSWGGKHFGNYHSSFEFEDGGVWLTTEQIQENTFTLSLLGN